MKNLGILLDDRTIINFSFFVKLLKRYYVITTLSPVLVIAIAAYIYKTQNDIFSVSVGMVVKANANAGKSSGSIASLLGREKKILSAAEILSMGRSIDFGQQMAKRIYGHPEFGRMNFNSISVKQLLTNKEIFAPCQEEEKCILTILRAKFSKFYSIGPDRVIPNKYGVTIKSLDPFTSNAILTIASDEIVKARGKSLLFTLTEQIRVTKELIEKKKSELEDVNIVNLEDLIVTKDKALKDVQGSTNSYRSVYIQQKLQLNKVKLTVKETEATVKKRGSSKDKVNFEKYQELQKQIDRLREDLRVLELSSANNSEQDNLIILQIKRELKRKEKSFSKLGNVKRRLKKLESFQESKDKSSDLEEFNYNVLKGQIEDTQSELEKLTFKKKELEKERLFLVNQLKTLKPSFEYLKLLEGKLIQLELVKWTIGSDLSFDKINGQVKRFKRTTIGKISVFAFMISFFMIFGGIVMRYIFDRRIYDEYELSKNFEGLEIIGNTPEFD